MIKEYISPIIANRFPDFVKEDYPAFDKFLRDYLAWMEQDDGFLQILNDWRQNNEPSNNVEPYIDAIIRDVGFVFEKPITIPKSTLLHFLKDFYLSRGSVQSFEFLFRVLFNDRVRIEYPRDRMFWLSSANYGQRHYIFIRSTHSGTREYEGILNNVSEFAGTLYGSQSQITAFVESVQPILFNGGEYLKVEIQRPLGEFLPTDLMTLTVDQFSINEQIMSIVNLLVDNPGIGYLPGELVTITGTDVVGTASIGTTSKGGVTSIEVVDSGCNYKIGDIILARQGYGGSGFAGQVTSVGLTAVSGEPSRIDSILTCEVLSQGYEYSSVPEIFPKRPTESMIFDPRFEEDQRNTDQQIKTPIVPVSSKNGGNSVNSGVTLGIVDTEKEDILKPPAELGEIQPPVLTRITPCVASLLAHSTNIGQIKTVNFGSPYIGFSNPVDVNVSIQTINGTGATFIVKPITRFSVSAWEDNKGFLGEKCVIQDSDKYQQFSYEIISSINPDRYQSVVSDLLHPVGYIRSSIVEIENTTNLGIGAGVPEISSPQTFEYNEIYIGYQSNDFSISSGIEIDVIAVSGGDTLADEDDNDIIWTD